MRPDPVLPRSVLGRAVGKGLRAARQNLVPMLMLEASMAVLVAIYYFYPPGQLVMDLYANWQHQGGIVIAALATGVAGGVISELSLVYFQHRGHWTFDRLENMTFKFLLFVVNGAVVYEFYVWQGIWFGQGPSWTVIVPKVIADQFAFSIIWSLPYLTILTRWHVLRYSWPRLKAELKWSFVTERMLPVLVTNWMFWIPGVSLIYSMPFNLQTPLFIFAAAIWSILLAAVNRQGHSDNEPPHEAPVAINPPALADTAD